MSSSDASKIVQCNQGIFNSFRLLSIKKEHGFPRTLCDVTCFGFDLVMMQLLLLEEFISIFDDFNLSELVYT